MILWTWRRAGPCRRAKSIIVHLELLLCHLLYAIYEVPVPRNSMNSSRFPLKALSVKIGGSKQIDIPLKESILLFFILLVLIWFSLSSCAPIGPTYEGDRHNILH